MYSTTAGQAEDKNNFWFSEEVFSERYFANSAETKSAPKAVSETPQNPIFFKAAINCSEVKSENSAEKEGARETTTFSFKVRSCFVLAKSSRICFALAGQFITQFPHRIHF